MRPYVAAALIAAALSATATAATPPPPTPITVTMANRQFAPRLIRLRRGVPYRLRIVNADNSEHDFAAPAFFRSSKIARRDFGLIDHGHINVAGGAERAIDIIPEVAAPFDLKSTKLLDVASGMQGQILVY